MKIKHIILSIFFLSTAGYAAKKDVAAKYDYVCSKGNKQLIYRIVYKTEDGLPPCRVYVIENGNKTKIAESMKTISVCEKVIDRVLDKLEREGMDCSEAN